MTIFFKLFLVLSTLGGGIDGRASGAGASKSKKDVPRVCAITRQADGTLRCVCQ